MKTFTSRLSVVAFAALFTLSAIGTSCNKDKTCHGTVHVKDTGGIAVGNAAVKFDAQSVNGDIIYNGTTDGSGDVTIDVKLPAIFDVTVTKGTLSGAGVIRLDEPGKDAEAKITVY